MAMISLKLPAALGDRLERAARRGRRSKSQIVREALEQFLNAEPELPSESALETMRAWVGCVDGPRDLAANPRHMDGFGT